jgi:hypothetical protein
VLTQALAKHIEQLVALPDELRKETIMLHGASSVTPAGATMGKNCRRRSQQSANLVVARWRGSCESAVSLESRPACRPAFPWESRNERRAGTPSSCI